MNTGFTAQHMLEGLQPVAVVDIGSNSVRLLVYEGAKRSPSPIFNEKILCGLGRSLATSGKLSAESMDRAVSALKRFRALADQMGVKTMKAVATAAVREADNGPDFVKLAEKICKTEISVLSGREEALFASYGVISGVHKADGIAGDFGGGSLELMDVGDQKFNKWTTLPLGGLRLIDISCGDLNAAAQFVDQELEKADWLEVGKDKPFYAIGGTWRAFAKLHMAQTRYPLRVSHIYRISTDEALKFAFLMDHLSPSSLEGIEEISRARRETVPYGALVLEKLIRRIKPSEVVFSAFGLREGLLYSLLPSEERRKDPLLENCRRMADLRSRSPIYANELCRWTDPLFKKPGPKESPEERRLRHAACLLSDISWRAHAEYRGEQSLMTIAHAAFPAVDHPGRVFLAFSVYFRHQTSSIIEAGESLIELIDEKAQKRARMVGAAIRVAHIVSASMPNVIPNTPLVFKKNKLVLHLPGSFKILEGERLHRRLSSLANLLDVDAEIDTSKKVKPDEMENATSR